MRAKILKKYDKNNDNFVEIDEYLAEEMSKGPEESRGNIDYHFQDYANVYNFFTILTLKNISAFKILCIPQFTLTIDDKYIVRTNAVVDLYDKRHFFPNTMKDSIKKCIDSEARLIYFNLQLKWSKEWCTHSNFVLIDTKRKTVERFEPHGCNSVGKGVDKFFKNHGMEIIGLSNYKYLGPELLSPKIGIQRTADAFTGLCIPIGMMYFLMRIMNIDTKQKVIVEYFTKMGKEKLKKVILKFTKYIENTLKENSDLVNLLNHELYNLLGGLKKNAYAIMSDY